MLQTLAQTIDAVVPKDESVASLNTYLIGVLFLLCSAAFTYLLGQMKQLNQGKEAATEKMMALYSVINEKSEKHLSAQMAEHQKDREAYLLTTGELKNAVVESTRALSTLTHEVTREFNSLREELRRSGEQRAV